MRYAKFSIRNFKGVRDVHLDLGSKTPNRITILVGLNESGKTTLLEALSFFYDNFSIESEPALFPMSVKDVHTLIPISQRDNFNGKISVSVSVELDPVDVDALAKQLSTAGYETRDIQKTIRLVHEIEFKNSSFQTRNNSVGYSIIGRPIDAPPRTRFSTLERPPPPKEIKALPVPPFEPKPREPGDLGSMVANMAASLSHAQAEAKAKASNEVARAAWLKSPWFVVADWLRANLPPIIYFPNFLFDVPDRIYIESADAVPESEKREQKVYRSLLQDVLDSLSNDLQLDVHVLARAKSDKQSDKDALESVLNKMATQMTRTIFGGDSSIFGAIRRGKSVFLTPPKRESGKALYAVELRMKDGQDTFYLRERSLGFRWFATFQLLTRFRIARLKGRMPVFLFDEPASNLHQTAQQKLLRALDELTRSAARVVYSTHSHHLIDPKWLETTFIVQNEALDYDAEEEFDTRQTNISVERYGAFVSKNPTKTTYFQPILDVLEYRPGALEHIPAAVMVEGKSDFYCLSYFSSVVLGRKALNLLPGTGSGNLDLAIQLYIAWGRRFVVFLDGDSEGEKQKKRYADKFGVILEGRVFSISDVDPDWKGRDIEDLIEDIDKVAFVSNALSSGSSGEKKALARAVQELLVKRVAVPLTVPTTSAIAKVLDFLEQKLDTQGGSSLSAMMPVT